VDCGASRAAIATANPVIPLTVMDYRITMFIHRRSALSIAPRRPLRSITTRPSRTTRPRRLESIESAWRTTLRGGSKAQRHRSEGGDVDCAGSVGALRMVTDRPLARYSALLGMRSDLALR
jgi:hypothetical protein